MAELIRREDLHWADLSDIATDTVLPPVTPGEVLRTEFMEPLGCQWRLHPPQIGRLNIGSPALPVLSFQ